MGRWAGDRPRQARVSGSKRPGRGTGGRQLEPYWLGRAERREPGALIGDQQVCGRRLDCETITKGRESQGGHGGGQPDDDKRDEQFEERVSAHGVNLGEDLTDTRTEVLRLVSRKRTPSGAGASGVLISRQTP